LRLNLQEIGGLDDFRAAEPPKFQKMIVTGDKIFGSGGNDAFKYAVIRSETARRMAPDSARLSIRRGIPAKFSREMKMFVSAVTRSTLTGSVGPDGGDLRLYVCWLQTAFPSVPLSKFKSLAPFRAVQASFYGIRGE
jgi:hypothetical protein